MTGAGALKQHLNYVKRDGAGRNGEPTKLYGEKGKDIDAGDFAKSCEDDQHHFRIIVSPEDAHDLQSLTDFTRDLVREMESDLGTKLEWVAADHYDTGQPHTHLIIRGKRDDGRDLVMPRKYISHGIRERAQGLVELEHGPVPEHAGRARLAHMVSQERFTELDRPIFEAAREDVFNLRDQSVRAGQEWCQQLARMRLKKLTAMGLAEPLSKGRWRLDPNGETTLRRMGARGDIIKTVHQAMAGKTLNRPLDERSIFDVGGQETVTGAVADMGLADDVNDRAFVVIDGMNGRPVYAIIGGEDQLQGLARGQLITLTPANTEPKPADRIIAKIADAQNGRYSPRLHMDADPSARPAFVEAHVRRLEALRRAGHAERSADGMWTVPDDFLARARKFEEIAALERPAEMSRQSTLTLKQMQTAIGATWIDEHLRNADDDEHARGFGADVEEARAVRRAFLIRQGLLRAGEKRVTQNVIDTLRTRDLADAGADLEQELGKTYTAAPTSGRIDGIYAKAIDRPSGRFAVVERSKDFTLVPWRDVMDRNLGKSVSGLIRDGQINWRLTRGRGIGRT